MAINKEVAAKWSRDRIREEIEDLRRQIMEYNRDAAETRANADDLANEIASDDQPYSSSRYKTTEAMYDYASKMHDIVYQLEDDLEFLKTLL